MRLSWRGAERFRAAKFSGRRVLVAASPNADGIARHGQSVRIHPAGADPRRRRSSGRRRRETLITTAMVMLMAVFASVFFLVVDEGLRIAGQLGAGPRPRRLGSIATGSGPLARQGTFWDAAHEHALVYRPRLFEFREESRRIDPRAGQPSAVSRTSSTRSWCRPSRSSRCVAAARSIPNASSFPATFWSNAI